MPVGANTIRIRFIKMFDAMGDVRRIRILLRVDMTKISKTSESALISAMSTLFTYTLDPLCDCNISLLPKQYFAGMTGSSLVYFTIPVCPRCGTADRRCASRKVVELAVSDVPAIDDMTEVASELEPQHRRRKSRAKTTTVDSSTALLGKVRGTT